MSKAKRGRPSGSAKTKDSKKYSLPSILPTFLENELTKDNCTCSLCVSILIEPVSLPCFHRLCLKCFDAHVKESLYCPFCRKRLSIWSRQISNSKDGNYVDLDLWDKIKAKFPSIVKARLEELENENNQDSTISNSIEIQNQIMMEQEKLWNNVNGGETEETDHKRDAILITEKGEILEDLNKILNVHIGDLEEIKRKESDASRAYILKLEEEERRQEEEDRKKLEEQMNADFELAKKLQEEEEALKIQNKVKIMPKISPPATRGKQKGNSLQTKSSNSSTIKKRSIVPQKRKLNNKPSASTSAGGSQSSILNFVKSERKYNKYMDEDFGEYNDNEGPSSCISSSFVPFISTPDGSTGSTRKTSTETITNSNSSHFDDENLNTDDDEYNDFVVKEEYEDDSFAVMSPLKRRRIPKDGTPDSLSAELNSHFRPIKTAPKTPIKLSTADSLNNCLAKPKPTYLPAGLEPEKKQSNTFLSHSASYLGISNLNN